MESRRELYGAAIMAIADEIADGVVRRLHTPPVGADDDAPAVEPGVDNAAAERLLGRLEATEAERDKLRAELATLREHAHAFAYGVEGVFDEFFRLAKVSDGQRELYPIRDTLLVRFRKAQQLAVDMKATARGEKP